MSAPQTSYATTAEALKDRILQMIPAHPEILQFKSAWDLFNVPEFRCGDLAPSLGQATWALAAAQREHAAGLRQSAPAEL